MAESPLRSRRRPRRGSLERPVNARMVRGTWLLVALPLLVAAFSVSRPAPLPPPTLPPAFDAGAAARLTVELATSYPSRVPGSPGAAAAARWTSSQLAGYGFRVQVDRFRATIPGEGTRTLENLTAVAPGCSPQQIVVMAHRDDSGIGPGASDNASGTAALIELARVYGHPTGTGCGAPAQAAPVPATTRGATPAHTIVFLSSDGGAFGGLGADHFARRARAGPGVLAVINLDAIAGQGPPRLEIAGDEPRSPAGALVRTAAVRILEETGSEPTRPSALRQLLDLGFPFSLYEQAPFVARGIPAVTVTSAADRPPEGFRDTPARIDGVRLGQLGRAAQELLGSLDQGLEIARGSSSYLYLGTRLVRGWAIELVLIAALVPYLAGAVDLFARCRRRRIPLGPAFRSLRSRIGFWLFAGATFELFALAGAWPSGAARPLAPFTSAARHWPLLPLLALGLLIALGWVVTRERLIPRRPASAEDELAGHTAALLALGVVGLLAVSTNPFALVFLLPSLHAWLWLPQVRARSRWSRAAVLGLGLTGPALLVGSLAFRFGLGADAFWYLAELRTVGYLRLSSLAVALCWAGAAAQLATIAAGRYAPYPTIAERPPRGPVRETVRAVVLAIRRRRRAPLDGPRALEG